MSAQAQAVLAATAARSLAERIEALDWEEVCAALDAQGSAVLERLMSPDECRAMAGAVS